MARRRSGKKIDFTHWTGFGQTLAVLASGTPQAVLVAPALHEPETLLRTRGELLVYADGVQTPGGLTQVAVGLIPVPEGTGATVLWSPIADDDAPWFFYWTGCIGYEEMVTDVLDVPAISGARIVMDSKAMRILRNQEIQLVAESVTAIGGINTNVSVSGRFLTGT